MFLYFQASAHQKNLDVGANLFIGNLDPEVDEKMLYDIFSAFGVILQTPKVSGTSVSDVNIEEWSAVAKKKKSKSKGAHTEHIFQQQKTLHEYPSCKFQFI